MARPKDDELRTVQPADSVQTDVESVHDAEEIDYPPRRDQARPLPPSKTYQPFSPHVLALLIPFSIFGTLARLGLQDLTTYDGQSLFPLAYVQSLGCLVMGFFLPLKGPMGEFYAPLYTAITTGKLRCFCGSLTTFSGWQYDIFSSWINLGGADRGRLYDFIDGLTKTVFTLSLSIGSMAFGSYLCKCTVESSFRKFLPAPPSRPIRIASTILSVLAYAATIPLYFRLSSSFRHKATAALLFAFPGTLTRYVLSVYLNPILASFPLGTFTANSIGTALLAVFHVLQNMGIKSIPVSPHTCSLLQGLGDGFCGCLTTISTFAAEIRALKEPFQRVRYVLLSWVIGQALVLVVVGPALLSGERKERVCLFE